MNHLYHHHLLSINDLSRSDIELILKRADKMPGKDPMHPQTEFLKGKSIALAFFEPSTRTRMSFEFAQKYLGGSTIDLGDLDKTSLKKGESLDDTLQIIIGYTNALIIRSKEINDCFMAKHFADESGVVVINAGNGSDEHPTQSLVDLYTIKKRFGKLEGLNVGIIGDLKYGRTVHSLVMALNHFDDNHCYLLSPKGLELPIKYFNNNCVKANLSELSDLINEFDVLYATRIQKERMSAGVNPAEFSYVINQEVMSKAKNNMIIMHPLPRIKELPTSLDKDPRAAYFEQAFNGVIVRQSLLYSLLRRQVIL